MVLHSLVPVLFAYGRHHKEEKYKTKAFNWLEETAAQRNAVTKGFSALQLVSKTAYDSLPYIKDPLLRS